MNPATAVAFLVVAQRAATLTQQLLAINRMRQPKVLSVVVMPRISGPELARKQPGAGCPGGSSQTVMRRR